jgi:hypothetical protein
MKVGDPLTKSLAKIRASQYLILSQRGSWKFLEYGFEPMTFFPRHFSLLTNFRLLQNWPLQKGGWMEDSLNKFYFQKMNSFLNFEITYFSIIYYNIVI